MRKKSPSRTPQSLTKRNRHELNSSEDDGDYDVGTPDRQYETTESLDTTGSPNYGWSLDEHQAKESSIGWRHEYNSKRSDYSPESAYIRQRVRPYDNYEQYISESIHREFRSKAERTTPSLSNTPSDPSNIYTYIIVGIIILMIVSGLYAFSASDLRKTPVQCLEFKELDKRFTHQDKLLWKSLKVGTEGVLNKDPTQPSVFLFAYNDQKSIDKVMLEIVNATASCMKSKNPIQLKSSALANEAMLRDHGEVIKAFKKQLEQEGIMYVADINKVPTEPAKAFHSICDTVTPLVSRLVIFFTMHLPNLNRNMSTKEILMLVEQELEKSWNRNGEGAITENTLQALIARITDQVFLLHSENEISL